MKNQGILVKKWDGEDDGIIFISDIFDLDAIKNYKKVIIGPHIDFTKSLNYLKN